MRNKARQYFKGQGLSYEVLNSETITLLAEMIQKEIDNTDDKYCHLVKINKPKKGYFLTVKGRYFSKREAVSFDSGGFIGFAGWADDHNVKPITTGFIKWCDKLVLRKYKSSFIDGANT